MLEAWRSMFRKWGGNKGTTAELYLSLGKQTLEKFHSGGDMSLKMTPCSLVGPIVGGLFRLQDPCEPSPAGRQEATLSGRFYWQLTDCRWSDIGKIPMWTTLFSEMTQQEWQTVLNLHIVFTHNLAFLPAQPTMINLETGIEWEKERKLELEGALGLVSIRGFETSLKFPSIPSWLLLSTFH